MPTVTVRQRNQITIPKSIAEAAGIHEGVSLDMQYANGVIMVRIPTHADPVSVLRSLRGGARGGWGDTSEEIEATIRADRQSWARSADE